MSAVCICCNTFFADVTQESETMLEWAAEQTAEITTTGVDLEFVSSENSFGSHR